MGRSDLYKGKVVFRDVTFWPNDFIAIKRIATRLKKLYNSGSIMRTGDIDDLKRINKRLEKFIKEYDVSFENHSA